MSTNNGFTENADLYRTSLAHSETPDLESCLESLPPIPGLSVLDIGTGSGHSAFFFAKKQAHTFAVDINDEMLRVAQEESDKLTLSIRFLKCPAEDLMFDDQAFDLVTCRLAAHHFENLEGFLQEAHRVLRPNGTLLLIDNVVPEEPQAADWLNQYEAERDPTHQRCLTAQEWNSLIQSHGFEVQKTEPFKKRLLFQAWMERMGHSVQAQETFWQRLNQAPESAKRFWSPKGDSLETRTVRLQQQIVIAARQH